MRRNKIRELTPKTALLILIPVLLIIVFIGWASYRFIQPVPPRTLTMTTGMEGGSFAIFGERYRQILARDGIHLKQLPSTGAVDNLRRLKDESRSVDTGFVQDGMGKTEDAANLESLGSLFYTPLWVFYRGDETFDDLSQLRGKRVSIGPEGSGVRKISLDLLKEANVSVPPAVLHEYPNPEAGRALMEGKVDAVLTFGSTDSALVRELITAPGIKLMSMSQAEAYTRLFPHLSHVILPKGILNPSKRFPASDIHLLAPTTNLLVQKDLHPALVYLLLKAAVEIHGGAGWVHRAGEFPSMKTQDFPISEQAKRFYRSGGSWLYGYLPFWAATFVDRMLLVLISIGMVLIPMIGILPWFYTWRNRSKYYRWYRELRELEEELKEHERPENVVDYNARLDRIEEAVCKIRVSVAFYDEVFILKEHIQMVRLKLSRLIEPEPEKTDLRRGRTRETHSS
jgi:TRAP transporter TAXI family solute receptor